MQMSRFENIFRVGMVNSYLLHFYKELIFFVEQTFLLLNSIKNIIKLVHVKKHSNDSLNKNFSITFQTKPFI